MPNPAQARGSTRPAASPTRVAVALVALVAVAAVLIGVVGGGLGASVSPVALASGSAPPTASSTAAIGASPTPSGAGLTPSPTGSPPPPASPSPSPSAPVAIPAERLQAALDGIRAKATIPGVSVAILWDDGRSWLGASGLADVAAKIPVTPASGFALASISKTFTAAVVLQLVGEGRLSLDDPVAPLLPAFKLDTRITIRMLLDHTSGLPDYFLNPKINAPLLAKPGATWTAARSWSYVVGKRPVPGTTWAYSNSNYLLLGELVGAVTGRQLAVEVRDRLLDPLGLASTWYQVAERPRTSLTVGYTLVKARDGSLRPRPVAPASTVMPFRSVVTAAAGAGSIASTALDAARWMRAFAGGPVLSPAMRGAMLLDAQITAALKARITYGLGIQVVTIAGRTALGHSGRYAGFQDVVRYLPDEGVTIAVLTNQNLTNPSVIADALLGLVLPALPSPSPSPGASASPAASGAVSPVPYASALP